MKMCSTPCLALSAVLLCASPVLFAADEEVQKKSDPNVKQYRLVYSKNSPMKDLSLNNADIKVRLFSNGIPQGHQAFKTNEQGEFEFTMPKHVHYKSINMNVVQIQDDAKKNEVCEGYLSHSKNELKITCYKKRNHQKSVN